MLIKKMRTRVGVVSLLMPLVTLTSCGKSNCTLLENHTHKYVKGDFVRYLTDEHLNNSGYAWTDEVMYINSSELELYTYETKKDLIKIDLNEDALRKEVRGFDDYLEYEYEYTVPKVEKVNDVTITRMETHHDWTKNPEHDSLTGNVRLRRYTYTGYKIDTKSNGKYKLTSSTTYYDIDSVIKNKDVFPYMKVNFYDIEVSKHGKIEKGVITYDDGTIDEIENYKTYKKH